MTIKQWDSSPVMREFEKNAADLGWITTNLNPKDKDFVGNPSESPVGPFRNNPMKDEKDLTVDKNPCKDYDITKETGEDLVGKAHKKSPTMADAMGEGALVENIVEQQEKDIEIATKMPTGALIQPHASLIQSLVKIANKLDEQGKYKQAAKIDAVIEKLSLPFVNKREITKEALFPAILMGLTALIGAGGAANMGFFSSMREDLPTDIKDLYDTLKTAGQSKWYSSSSSPSATAAAQLLEPFIGKFQGFNFKDEKEAAKYTQVLTEFKPVLDRVGMMVNKVELELGESRWFQVGADRVTRVKAKYSDIVEDYEFVTTKLAEIGQEAQQSGGKLPGGKGPVVAPSGVSGLQSILVENSLLNSKKADGNLNPETIEATKNLEEWITTRLATMGIKKSMKDKIVANGKLIMPPEKVREIVDIIKKELSK